MISESANDFESCFMIVCTIHEDDVFFMKDAGGLLKSMDILDNTLIVLLLF